jgi:cytochrome c oxidase subunit 2
MLAKLFVLPPQQFALWYAGQPVEVEGLASAGGQPAGLELLRQKGCLACHSTDGSESAGPTFQGLYGRIEQVVREGRLESVTVDDAYLRRSILTPAADLVVGFRNLMPPGKPALSDEEIEQIVAYLHELR